MSAAAAYGGPSYARYDFGGRPPDATAYGAPAPGGFATPQEASQFEAYGAPGGAPMQDASVSPSPAYRQPNGFPREMYGGSAPALSPEMQAYSAATAPGRYPADGSYRASGAPPPATPPGGYHVREEVITWDQYQQQQREQAAREYYSRGRDPSVEYRSAYDPRGAGEAREAPAPYEAGPAAEYAEAEACREAAPAYAAAFPRDASFVAEPFRDGSPLYGQSSRSYPSAAPAPAQPGYGARERSSSPMYGGASSAMYGGAGSYPGYAYGEGGYPRDPRAYSYSGYNAYDGAARGGYPYGYAGGDGRGDSAYSGGMVSYAPAPSRSVSPMPMGGGASGYGGSANGYGGGGGGYGAYGSSSNAGGYGASSLSYGFPAAGSFVAEPFAFGAPSGTSRTGYMPPATSYGAPPIAPFGAGYGAADAFGAPGGYVSPQYGGAGGASPFPPSAASFLAPMPDFGATGLGGGLGGPLGSAPAGGLGLSSAPSASTPDAAGGAGGAPPKVIPPPSLAEDPPGGSPPGAAGTGHGTAERPPYKPAKVPAAIAMKPRTKKRSGRLGCC